MLFEHTRRIVDVDQSTVMAQAHVDGQRVSGPHKIVAIHAVRHGSVCVQRRRRLSLRQQSCDTRETRIDSTPDETYAPSDTAVDKTCDTARAISRRSTQGTWPQLYGAVHLLDDLGNGVCRVDGHARSATEVRQL